MEKISLSKQEVNSMRNLISNSQKIIHTINYWQQRLVSTVQWLSCVWLFATPRTAAHQAPLSISNSQSLLKHMSIESVMPSNHLILSHPLLLLGFDLSQNQWDFPFPMSQFFPSGDQSMYSGLISFRNDWLDPLEVQGTLKSPLQHHSSKASILRCSTFFMV